MAKETVQAVREAELNATQIEKNAEIKRAFIISKAQEDAETAISSTTTNARLKLNQELEQMKLQVEKLMEEAEQKALMDIVVLKEVAQKNERTAIDIVISTIIG